MVKSLSSSLVAIASLGLAAPLLAQDRSVVSNSELDAAVTIRSADAREAVRSVFATEQARRAAGQLGLDAEALSRRVASLDDQALDLIARRADLGDRVLAGGNTIVISTTAIIIALLVLILITD